MNYAAHTLMRAASPIFPAASSSVAEFRQQFRGTGVAVLLEPALDMDVWNALRSEAAGQRSASAWHLYSKTAPGEIQQDNIRGRLGPVARALLSSPETLDVLLKVTGRHLEPAWSASCYTYYDIPGTYMGEHCDKFNDCRVAFLFYLEARWFPGHFPGPGLQLHIYEGDNSRTTLVRRVTAHSNRAVIVNGAEQAHLRPPLAPGESLMMLAGCFRLMR
jgi:hypothetical protein